MSEVVEVSYTGDLLAHRRCGRAWAYEKHVGFHPYEQVQAMEGRLIHHAMEWLTDYWRRSSPQRHASRRELETQLRQYWRVLWARGVRTAFESKEETLKRVLGNLFVAHQMDPVVRAIVEGAQHSEYELRAVRKVLPSDVAGFGGKSRILLTGILDVVVQQTGTLQYDQTWEWTSKSELTGRPKPDVVTASIGDVEIWDYKGSRAKSPFVTDYVRQVLTYAALYEDRTGTAPRRCVLFFVNEPRDSSARLLSIGVSKRLTQSALTWTVDQVRELQSTVALFELDPRSVPAGDLSRKHLPIEQRVQSDLVPQCTACGQRFGCSEYEAYLSARPTGSLRDTDILNVNKN